MNYSQSPQLGCQKCIRCKMNSKRKAPESIDEVVLKKIKQEPEDLDLIGVEFEAFENRIKDDPEEPKDVKIEPTEDFYELAKYNISLMNHQDLVAKVQKNIDKLRMQDLSMNHRKNLDQVLAKAFESLIKLVIRLDNDNIEMKKDFVTLIKTHPDSNDAQVRWVRKLELESRTQESKSLREELDIIRMIDKSQSKEELDRKLKAYYLSK